MSVRSKCCEAVMYVCGRTTFWHICSACGLPCDAEDGTPVPSPKGGPLYRCNGWNRCKVADSDCPARGPHVFGYDHRCCSTFHCPALNLDVRCVPCKPRRKRVSKKG